MKPIVAFLALVFTLAFAASAGAAIVTSTDLQGRRITFDVRATAVDTDWRQIVQLYDQLQAIQPSPVVALNRAVAVAELEGPAAALHEIDTLDLDTYHLFHSTRADLLGRLGRYDEARDAYERALALTANAAEHTLLARKRDALPRA